METHIKVKLGFEQAKLLQGFDNLASVVGSIFGSDKKSKSKAPTSGAQAEAQFNGLFNK